MTDPKSCKKATVAERAIEVHSRTRIYYLIIGGLLALTMILGGYHLTQRQMDLKLTDTNTEFQLKVINEEFKLKSTYPGLVLIVCGTVLAMTLIRKRFYFETQHKDSDNNIPGHTKLES